MMVGDQVDVMTAIPLVDLKAAHVAVAAEIQAGFDDVISSTAFIKGEVAAAFERDYAAFTGGGARRSRGDHAGKYLRRYRGGRRARGRQAGVC
jgi:hypothetical protein